jgi:hypothetical protein
VTRVGTLLVGAAAAGLPAPALVTVDRIEGNWAVVEWPDGSFSDLPLLLLPAVSEGDRLALHPILLFPVAAGDPSGPGGSARRRLRRLSPLECRP